MSLVALVDGKRILADRDGPRRGQCPGCNREMVAKTGDVITWHWAHTHDESDPCQVEPETEWHLGWKSRCTDTARIEVARGSRRADVLTPYGWAVEFQHSPLSVGEVHSREADWRRNLIWVMDGREATEAERLRRWRPESRHFWTMRWAWAPVWVRDARCRTFVDIGGDQLIMVGRWYEKDPDRPVMGYGWDLTADQFTDYVINGKRPPRLPGMNAPLDAQAWAATVVIRDCPACALPLAGAPGPRCSAARFHQGAA